jgi:DNA-binding NarL/FixJ family response regulator
MITVGIGFRRGIVSVLRKTEDVDVVVVADMDKNALEQAASYIPREYLETA